MVKVTKIIKNNEFSFLLLFVMALLPISVSSVSTIFLSMFETSILNFSFLQWSLFYLLTSFTMAFALTPTTYIALVSGYFLGWISLTGLIPSYVLASLIGFYLSGKLDKGKLLTYFSENKKIGNVIENLKTNELWVIFFCRISPALPFAMMNVFLAFMKVRMKNFVLGSIVGMLPRTLVSVWIGTQAHDIIKILTGKEEMTKSNLLALILLLFSAVGLYWLFAKAVKKYQQ